MLKSKITTVYEKHNCQRICQGDILRDVQFYIIGKGSAQVDLKFPYVIVISQDCDLEEGEKKKVAKPTPEGLIEFNQYLPNILILPAFPAELVKQGEHLKELFSVKPVNIGSDLWKFIKKNSDPRYQFLHSDVALQIPEMVIDFKIHYSVPFCYFEEKYKKFYLATINELFRERLSQRFFSYLNRIGLPNIKTLSMSVEEAQ
ncbi:MAG: hypothetical protein NT088_02875 [Candidatus Omnitrophica bacterium]|nr:hypothetical protein [Candidatus Omnitrophota bacterium]